MKRGFRIAAWLAGTMVLALVGLVIAGVLETRATPIERQAEKRLHGMAPSSGPYRVALLSDIHFGNRAMQPERLKAIVTQVNRARPDLIVIVGDFVNGYDHKLDTDPVAMAAPLSALKARDGVIATLGNHEHWTDAVAVETALQQAGIAVLDNKAVQRGPLVVLGLDDAVTGHADIAKVLAEARGLRGVPVAINHTPSIGAGLPKSIELVLAGHTHCGQINLPIIGSLSRFTRHRSFDPRYLCGRIDEGSRTTIVTAGLGSGSVPLRIGAPPDWWLVTLRAP